MASAIDATKPVAGTPTTASVRANFAAAKSEIEALQAEAVLAWVPVTFLNSWVDYGAGYPACEVCIDEKKIVRLRGMAKNGTIGAPALLLPIGYRPANTEFFACSSNDAFGSSAVLPNGYAYASVGSSAWFSFSGITFQAA